jgi:hypothetical protein
MAFDETLAARIRTLLARRKGVTEKRMFGGLAFLLRGNLCLGILRDSLIVRLGEEQAEVALRDPCVKRFDFTGRPMKNWVVVDPEGLAGDENLAGWVALGVAFVAEMPAKVK